MGTRAPLFSFGALRDAALGGWVLPVEITFRGGAGGEWRLRGMVSASRAPVVVTEPVVELEITLEIGGDDKHGANNVRFSVRRADGSVFGPVSGHQPRQTFPHRTLHPCRIQLDRPDHVHNLRQLLLHWEREEGDGWLRKSDGWRLRRIRVVGFDRLNHRVVMLHSHSLDTHFTDNTTLTIPLTRTSESAVRAVI